MKDEEIIDLIVLLFAKHVPDSLDKRQVLERLNKILFLPPAGRCPKCREPLICPDCDDIGVDTDVAVTLRVNGRTVSL